MSEHREPRRRSETTPELRDGVLGWDFAEGGATFLFLGRGTPRDRDTELPASWIPSHVARARLRQVHGAEVVAAAAGVCGEGDALTSDRRGLALEIATADCVPILLAGEERLGAVHAGWRGIAAGVVGLAVASLSAESRLVAWIGPAIGPCCYEVDEEVAATVAAAAPGASVLATPSARGRPRLELVTAVEAQLRAAGVERIRSLDLCTRCHPEWLWSYRRDGPGAGRNLALVYRT